MSTKCRPNADRKPGREFAKNRPKADQKPAKFNVGQEPAKGRPKFCQKGFTLDIGWWALGAPAYKLSACHGRPLPAVACHCLPLPAIACHCLPLPAIATHLLACCWAIFWLTFWVYFSWLFGPSRVAEPAYQGYAQWKPMGMCPSKPPGAF